MILKFGRFRETPPELSQQPSLRQAPFTLYRACGDLQNLGRFLCAESSKESQFHNLAFSWIQSF